MGIKMKKARVAGEEVKISEYETCMKGNLCCLYCNAPINYVSGHIRKLGDRDVPVKPYFKLISEKNHPHEVYCSYITSNIINNIFASVSDDELVTKLENKYITRLHIITDSMERKNQENTSQEISNTIQKSTKKYIRNGEQPAYLQTIAKIVKLKEALEDDKELSDLVVLQFYNEYKKIYEEVKWKDFYVDYDLKQYEHIYKLIKNKKAYHPICFSGEIKTVNFMEDKDFGVIKFYSLKQKQGEYLSFSITSKNKEVIDYASGLISRKVVIYGCKHIGGKTILSKKNNKKTIYNNFSTQINLITQIFVLD